MSNRLRSFYTGAKWTDFVKMLRLERVNEDGYLICEHCGKPIVKAYDCIGHHKIHLTEENVDDVTVSLNPENVQLVHHRCHNDIHNRFGYDKKEVFLVWGSPLSGKSSYVKEVMSEGDLLLDIDRIWDCISNAGYVKPKRLQAVTFRLRDDIMDIIRTRFGRWNNAYIVGGFPLISERERLERELGARLIHINTSKEECLARLETLTDNRDKDAWRGYIDDWWRLARL